MTDRIKMRWLVADHTYHDGAFVTAGEETGEKRPCVCVMVAYGNTLHDDPRGAVLAQHICDLHNRSLEEKPAPCVWSEDYDGNWTTSCDNEFTFFDGGPVSNGLVYCCYCGALIEQQLLNQAPIDEERASDA